jgi:hypothetical protein
MLAEPPPLRSEDTSAAESARRRIAKGKHLTVHIPRLSNLKARRGKGKSRPLAEQLILSNDNGATEIDLNNSCVDLNTGQDIYRWAVLYENQRGFASAPVMSI